MKIIDSVKAHYMSVFGPPSSDETYSARGVSVDILKWDAETHPEHAFVYCSAGASAYPIPHTPRNHRIEMYCGFVPDVEYAGKMLAEVSMYHVVNGVTVGPGHTIPKETPLWPGTTMDRIWITNPLVEILPTLRFRREHVEFLQILPLFEEEFRYMRKYGTETLLERWTEQEVPFWDPFRALPILQRTRA